MLTLSRLWAPNSACSSVTPLRSRSVKSRSAFRFRSIVFCHARSLLRSRSSDFGSIGSHALRVSPPLTTNDKLVQFMYLSWWHVDAEVNFAEWSTANLAHQTILAIHEEVWLWSAGRRMISSISPMRSHCSTVRGSTSTGRHRHCPSVCADRHQHYFLSTVQQILSYT